MARITVINSLLNLNLSLASAYAQSEAIRVTYTVVIDAIIKLFLSEFNIFALNNA